jgi:heptosyltransferase-2
MKFLNLEPHPKNLEFPLTDMEQKWADEYLSNHEIAQGDIVVGIVPGGGASWGIAAYKKQWPAHRFSELANRIVDRYAAKIILFGDLNEVALCNQVASLIKKISVVACGRTSLSKLAAIMKRCDLIICNDGGPLHIAVSQGVKNISIFGPVDQTVYGPYPEGDGNIVIKKDLICRPCYKRFKLKECVHTDCLTAIEVDEIMSVIDSFLSEDRGGA